MKRVPQISAVTAAAMVKDGDVLMAGGFGMTGNPVHLLHALAETSTKNLTYIGNNVGEPGLFRANRCWESGGRWIWPPAQNG